MIIISLVIIPEEERYPASDPVDDNQLLYDISENDYPDDNYPEEEKRYTL